jgi:hypothetical protein
MPKHPRILTVPAVLAVLTLLPPTLATARPFHDQAARPAAERSAADRGLLAQLRGLLSVLWAETGSVLEPDGKTTSGTTGDNGSILEPDGRR